MSLLSRRTLLCSGVAALSAPALASTDPVAGEVARWRGRWSDEARALVRGVVPADRAPGASAPEDEIYALAHGLAAIGAIKAVHALTPRDQEHPEVQRFSLDAAEAFGDAMLRTRELVKTGLGPPGGHRELLLRGVLRQLRVAIARDSEEPTRDRLLLDTLLAWEARPARGLLRAELLRETRRLDRLEALVRRAIAEGRGLDLLSGPQAHLAPGSGQRIADGVELLSTRENLKRLFGLVLLGAVFSAGFFLLLAGGCNTVCGNPSGAILAVAGVGMMALSIWGGLNLIAGIRASNGRPALEPDALPEEDDDLPEDATLLLHPDAGWQPVDWRGGRVRAFGQVLGPRGWRTDAAGEGASGPDAPLPGAPAGALLARRGDAVVLLGTEAALPTEGPLELGLNLPPAALARTQGFLLLLRSA